MAKGLRRNIDSNIKQAFVEALKRKQLIFGHDSNGRYDGFSLREVVVECDSSGAEAASSRLPISDPAGGEQNLLLAEVIEFCPYPLKDWQERASPVLEEHRVKWLDQLSDLKSTLRNEAMFAVPFGRFLNRDESETDWVSRRLQSVDISESSMDQVFENWSEVKANEPILAPIQFFIRPYIIWPAESSKPLEHVTYIRGRRIHITRPELNVDLAKE